MSDAEKATIVEAIEFCINRIRDARSVEDYEIAGDDVANKLCYLSEWLRGA